jgi:hypothetical protein
LTGFLELSGPFTAYLIFDYSVQSFQQNLHGANIEVIGGLLSTPTHVYAPYLQRKYLTKSFWQMRFQTILNNTAIQKETFKKSRLKPPVIKRLRTPFVCMYGPTF